MNRVSWGLPTHTAALCVLSMHDLQGARCALRKIMGLIVWLISWCIVHRCHKQWRAHAQQSMAPPPKLTLHCGKILTFKVFRFVRSKLHLNNTVLRNWIKTKTVCCINCLKSSLYWWSLDFHLLIPTPSSSSGCAVCGWLWADARFPVVVLHDARNYWIIAARLRHW